MILSFLQFIVDAQIYLINYLFEPVVYPVDVYLYGLPDDVEKIDLSNRNITSLPDLSRFYNLHELFVGCNLLTTLPPLPPNLKMLHCSNNLLTSLPTLPLTLKVLHCNHNQITRLPNLPANLEHLYCWRNQLLSLPRLPQSLRSIHCDYNRLYYLPPIPDSLIFQFHDNPIHYFLFIERRIIVNNMIILTDRFSKFKTEIEILNKFRYLFYSLKFKQKFRHWLWVRVREPKIREKYSPNNLLKLLDGCEDDELFHKLLDNWD